MTTLKSIQKNILSRSSVLQMAILSAIGWGSIYVIMKQSTMKEPEWIIRLLTAIHATVVTFLSLLDCFYINEWNIENLGELNSAYEDTVLSLMLGYISFHFFWILVYKTEGRLIYFHHIFSIITLITIIFFGISAPEALFGISGLEFTNPCLQARWFLRTYGYQGKPIHIFTEVLFMLLFITIRIFYGSYLTYNILLHPKCHIVLKVEAFFLYLISWISVLHMICYITKKYIRKIM